MTAMKTTTTVEAETISETEKKTETSRQTTTETATTTVLNVKRIQVLKFYSNPNNSAFSFHKITPAKTTSSFSTLKIKI